MAVPIITINEIDISTKGVAMLRGSYSALLLPPPTKEWIKNESVNKNGTDYLKPDTIYVKERTINLTFLIYGNDSFTSGYNWLTSVLLGGIIDLYVSDLGRHYFLKYESCTSLTTPHPNCCKLVVKFTEPNPAKVG